MPLNRLMPHLLFSLLLSSYLTIKSNAIYYNYSLSLTLLKDGVSKFIQVSRDKSEADYENALADVISLAAKNKTDVPALFQEIHSELEQRIDKIHYLKNKKIDPAVLAAGLGLIGIGMGLTYATYYTYKNYYQVNRNEHSTIVKYLESKGVKVYASYGGDVHLIVPPRTSYYGEGQKLLKLNNTLDEIIKVFTLEGIFQGFAYFWGVCGVAAGLDPHMNDRYLEKYQDMLTSIKKLQEKTL